MCQNLTAEYSSVEGGRIDWTGQNAGDTEEFGPSEDLHMAVMLDFLKAARSGTPASVSIRSAYRAQELVHTLIQSITEGRIINIR
jgi:predicted dehydrogenase